MAIEWLGGGLNRLLVTFNHQEKRRLIEECIKLYGGAWGDWEPKIKTVDAASYATGQLRGCDPKTELGFDNLDMILQALFNHYKPTFVTWTGGPEDVYARSSDQLNDELNRALGVDTD